MSQSATTAKLLSSAAALLEKRLYDAPPPYEELKAAYPLSDEYDKQILSLTKIIASNKSRRRSLRTIILVAAIITALIVFAICLGAKEGFLSHMTTNDVYKSDGTLNYTEITTDFKPSQPQKGLEIIFPRYVPDGYTRTLSETPLALRYINGDKYFILCTNNFGTSIVNTEKYEMHQLQIGDSIAYYIEVKKHNYIFITVDSHRGCFYIQGNLSLEECIKIIESIVN